MIVCSPAFSAGTCLLAGVLLASAQPRPLFRTEPSEAIETFDASPAPEFRSARPGVESSEGFRALPRDTYLQPLPPAIAPTTFLRAPVLPGNFFRNTGAPGLSNLRVPAPDLDGRSGELDASFSLDLPRFGGQFPLFGRGFDPAEADLKFGPVYFKLMAASAAALYSDNVNLRQDDREGGLIAIGRISAAVMVQLTEGFRLTLAGSFVYLPTEGSAGFSGFATRIPFSLGLVATPALNSQITYDTVIAGWPVTFANDLRLLRARSSLSTRDNFEGLEGVEFTETSQAGRYTFNAPFRTRERRDGVFRDDAFQDDTDDLIVLSNTVSALTERLLPGSVRLRARAYHENLWYNQGRRGLPSSRDGVDILARSEHENLRFKPFLTYNARRIDGRDRFTQQIRIGISGPITDQLRLSADAGVLLDGRGDVRPLFRLFLFHEAGPLTTETLALSRTVSDFDDEFADRLTYTIQHQFGARVTANAFASIGRVTDLLDAGDDSFSTNRDELRAGVRVGTRLGPKTRLTLAGLYTRLDGDDAFASETWTGRLDLTYSFTDSLLGQLLYQYQRRDSAGSGRDYTENLVFLSVTKYFD